MRELDLLPTDIRATASNDEIDKLVEMSYYAKNSSHSPSNYNVGLFFHLDDRESSDPPQKLAYDLRLPGRWSTMWIYDFLQLPGPGYSNEGKCSVRCMFRVQRMCIPTLLFIPYPVKYGTTVSHVKKKEPAKGIRCELIS